MLEIRADASYPFRSPRKSMAQVRQGDVTQWLSRRRDGDRAALDRLVPEVHGEPRRMAARYLRQERPEYTLQRTALVHEALAQAWLQREMSGGLDR
jgi:hypothetical protein